MRTPSSCRSRTRSTCTPSRPRDIVVGRRRLSAKRARRRVPLVRLIHGRGKGVQRAAIQRLLRGHPLVDEFWDAPESHLGATVVKLRRVGDPGQ